MNLQDLSKTATTIMTMVHELKEADLLMVATTLIHKPTIDTTRV